MAIADELQKLKELHASGSLTDAEHSAAKAKVLGTSTAPASAPPVASSPVAPRSVASQLRRGVLFSGVALLVLIFAFAIIGPMIAAHPGPIASPLTVFSPPQVIVDEDLVMTAEGGAQMRGFSLSRNSPVRIEVHGVRDTDKGFDVFLIEPSEWVNVKNERRELRDYPDFSSPKVNKMNKTGTLAAGSYGLAVRNSYNLLFGMTVHVKITINPK